jgi:hypothetical protein
MSTRRTRKNTPPLIENEDEIHNVPLGTEAAASAAAAAASAAAAAATAAEEPIIGKKRSRESPDPSVVEELQSVAAAEEEEPSKEDIEKAMDNITSSSTSSMPSLESETEYASSAADKVYELDKSIVNYLAQQHWRK